MTQHELKELRARSAAETGNRLSAAFEIARRSQAELVRESRFTAQYVSDMVRGRFQNVSIDNARVFSQFFGCQIEDLFPGRDDDANQQLTLEFRAGAR